MENMTKFRTAMGGFHRGDVTAYIEALCTEHRQTVKQLETERDDLSRKVEAVKCSLTAKTTEAEALRRKLADTETALESSQTALEEAMSMLEEQTQQPPQEEMPDYAAMELEAYRRAEATERLASERAKRLWSQVGDLVEGITERYVQTGQEIQVLNEDIRNNLQRLQEALSDLDVIFEETNQSFQNLDAQIPDCE